MYTYSILVNNRRGIAESADQILSAHGMYSGNTRLRLPSISLRKISEVRTMPINTRVRL